jgi:hypothetical protein
VALSAGWGVLIFVIMIVVVMIVVVGSVGLVLPDQRRGLGSSLRVNDGFLIIARAFTLDALELWSAGGNDFLTEACWVNAKVFDI